MNYRQVSLIGLITMASPTFGIVLTVSAPIASLPILFQTSQVLAQTATGRKAEANRLFNQGIEQYKTSHLTVALQLWEQALIIYREIKDRQGESHALGNLGLAYRALGNYKKAIDYHQQSLAIARELKDRLGEGDSLNNLGYAFQKSSKLPEAEKILYQGIEVWESLRGKLGRNDAYKVSIFEVQARIYRILQQVLIAENKPNEALEISERGRSRAFVELLSSRLSNKNPSQASEPNVDKPTISLLQQIAKQHHATLVQYSIIYDDFKVEGKQQSGESELYIWVIKPTGEITFRKADLKPLWRNEHTTLADLVDTSRQSIGVSGRGILVSYAPKPNALKTKQGLQQLPALPWAEKEAKDIASILKTQALTSSAASKTAILQKMSQAQIIHFATHGLLDDDRGLGSAIALTGRQSMLKD